MSAEKNGDKNAGSNPEKPAPAPLIRPPRLLWQRMWQELTRRLLRWLGLQRVDRRHFSLDGELGELIEALAAYEQRPPDEVAADLLAAGLAQRDLQSETWQRWLSLTPRQREVAALVCQGYTNRQIAARLYVSEDTVRTHVRMVLMKFGVHGRGELRLLLGEDWGEGVNPGRGGAG